MRISYSFKPSSAKVIDTRPQIHCACIAIGSYYGQFPAVITLQTYQIFFRLNKIIELIIESKNFKCIVVNFMSHQLTNAEG